MDIFVPAAGTNYSFLFKQKMLMYQYRLIILTGTEVPIGCIDSDIISGSLSVDRNSGIRRTLSLTILNLNDKYTPNSLTKMFWIGSRYRFDVGVSYGDNIYWFPQGIFTPISVSKNETDDELSISFSDKFAFLDGTVAGKLETTYNIPRYSDSNNTVNTKVKDILSSTLLQDCGMGVPYDGKPILYDETRNGAILYYNIQKSSGDSYGDIITELASMSSCDVYYNNVGNLCFGQTIEDVRRLLTPALFSFDERPELVISSSTEYNHSEKYNGVAVTGMNVNGHLCYAELMNTNPYSPLCMGNVPTKIKAVTDENIYSNVLAFDRARYELSELVLYELSKSFSVIPIPMIDIDKIIVFNRERYIVSSFSMDIGEAPTMKLSVTNIKEMPLFDKYGE